MSANIETLFATPRGPRDNQAVRDGENSYGDETQALVILVEAIFTGVIVGFFATVKPEMLSIKKRS